MIHTILHIWMYKILELAASVATLGRWLYVVSWLDSHVGIASTVGGRSSERIEGVRITVMFGWVVQIVFESKANYFVFYLNLHSSEPSLTWTFTHLNLHSSEPSLNFQLDVPHGNDVYTCLYLFCWVLLKVQMSEGSGEWLPPQHVYNVVHTMVFVTL